MKHFLLIISIIFAAEWSQGQHLVKIENANNGGIDGKYIVEAPGLGFLTAGRAYYENSEGTTGCEQAFISLLYDEPQLSYWDFYLVPHNWADDTKIISRIDKIVRAEPYTQQAEPGPNPEVGLENLERNENLTYLVGGTVALASTSNVNSQDEFGCNTNNIKKKRAFIAKISVSRLGAVLNWFTIIDQNTISLERNFESLKDFAYSASEVNNFIPVLTEVPSLSRPGIVECNIITLLNYTTGSIISRQEMFNTPSLGQSHSDAVPFTDKVSIASEYHVTTGKVNTHIVVGGSMWNRFDLTQPYNDPSSFKLYVGTVEIMDMLNSTSANMWVIRFRNITNPIVTTGSPYNALKYNVVGIEPFNSVNHANDQFYINAFAWGDRTVPPHNEIYSYPGYSLTFSIRVNTSNGRLFDPITPHKYKRKTSNLLPNYDDEMIFSHLFRFEAGSDVKFYSLSSRRPGPSTTGGSENIQLPNVTDIIEVNRSNTGLIQAYSTSFNRNLLDNWSPNAMTRSSMDVIDTPIFVIGDLKTSANFYRTYGVHRRQSSDMQFLEQLCQKPNEIESILIGDTMVHSQFFWSCDPINFLERNGAALEILQTVSESMCENDGTQFRIGVDNKERKAKLKEKINFEAYPNPASSTLNLQLNSNLENSRIFIFNSIGLVVKSMVFTSKQDLYTIDITDLPNGSYYARVVANEFVEVKKFLIQR